MLETVNITNLTALCKVFNSENRVEMFLKILEKKNPMTIAKDLNLSRAGLQKHLELLIETGLLIKNGKGRNTKYVPSKIATPIFHHLKQLGLLLETQREILRLESKLLTSDDMLTPRHNPNKAETRNSLNEKLKMRTDYLNAMTIKLQSWLNRFNHADPDPQLDS